MCVGGPPNPIHPSRPHSRRTVPADAWCIGAPAYGPTRRHRRARSPGGAESMNGGGSAYAWSAGAGER